MTPLERLAQKQDKAKYSSFVFPSYGMEFKFRRMDPIDETLTGRIPPYLGEQLMASLKRKDTGEALPAQPEPTNDDLQQWASKSYEMMKRLQLQPLSEREEEGRVEKILDENGEVIEVKALPNLPPIVVMDFLPETPLTDEQLQAIPTEEKMLWLIAAIANANSMETFSGGIKTAEEVVDFPDEGARGVQPRKRSANSKGV